MKTNYEKPQRYYLTRRLPVIIRVDGRAFHTFTKGLKAFDPHMMKCMKLAAMSTADQMDGCKLAYVQSDEVSFLLTDFDTIHTEAWFGYNKSKIETIAAATMSVAFNEFWGEVHSTRPVFDARAFSVPVDDVANYFLWRARDWERNSLAMYCQKFFSHKELMGKNKTAQHEMLHSIGMNWVKDLTPEERNGTFIHKMGEEHPPPKYEDIFAVVKFAWFDAIYGPDAV